MSIEAKEKFVKVGKKLADGHYSPFLDPDIPESTKQAWRRKGGELGGNPQAFQGVPLTVDNKDKLQGLWDAFEQHLANLNERSWSPAVMREQRLTLQAMVPLAEVLELGERLEELEDRLNERS